MVYRNIGQLHFDYLSSSDKMLKKNFDLYRLYKSERAFVVCNGPSLKQQPLKKIESEITICMNQFYLYNSDFTPSFCCIADRLDQFLFYEDRKVLDDIIKNTSPKDGWLFHSSLNPIIPKKINSYYAKTDVSVDSLTSVRKDWDLTSAVPGMRSASMVGLLLALYLGCDPIYLIGADCDWLSHRGFPQHCYEYDGHEPSLSKTKYADLASKVVKVFRGYETIKRYADYRNIKIYNATCGGFLDVFPRVDYTSLF